MTTAVQQLREIREQWGDLLAAIEQAPAPVWPPRQPSHSLDAEETGHDGPAVGRLPLTLRQHPAPLNLDALDAAMGIERGLFDLADQIAAVVQSVAFHHDGPDRWHYPTSRDIGWAQAAAPGSRGNGLHWCAVWIEDRLTQAEATPMHTRVPGWLAERATAVVADAYAVLARALGRDGRDTRLDDPCPWCHGTLTARTTSGDPHAATVTCDTGPTCTAPAPYDDRARRTWHGRDLVQLYGALTAARAAA